MIRYAITSPSSLVPWRPPTHSASPLASGPDKPCAVLARTLGMKGTPRTHGPPLCQGPRVFAARQHPGASPSTGPVGTLAAVHGKRRRGAGASCGRSPWGPRVHVHQTVVGRHDRHDTLASGTVGEAGGGRPPAACPPPSLHADDD